VSSSETDLRVRWETLSAEHAAATSALRALQEKAGRLEAEQSDFEMRLELAVRKKEAQLTDLRGVLEAAYEDIARLEGSGDRKTAAAGLQVATKINGKKLTIFCPRLTQDTEEGELGK
jgi:hypothetical protein